MKVETKLSKANSEYRKKNYSEALKLYLDFLVEVQDNYPSVILSIVHHNVEVCKKRLSLGVSSGDRPVNPIVITVNPSHTHPTEVEFWSEISAILHANSVTMVDMAFRKSEPFNFSHMVPHTARGHDLSKALLAYDQLAQPEWFDQATLNLLADWEHRRWQLQTYNPDSANGCLRLAKYIDSVVNALCPAMIVTTNKIDPPNYLFFLAARHYGIPYAFLERSPLNTYLLEDWGMFGESDVVESVIGHLAKTKSDKDEVHSERLLQVILGNPYGFRADEASRDQFVLPEGRQKPLFFLPLDNALWTGWAQENHPQGDVDYPLFRTPDIALKACAQVVEDLGGRFVVKPHPSCVEWLRLEKQLPNVEFTTADLDQLCSEADVVVTFLTKVSYLALAKGKPVVSFGGGLLDYTGTTYQVKSEGQLPVIFKEALAKVRLSEKIERFKKILPAIEQHFVKDGTEAAARLLKKMSGSRKLDAESRQQIIVKAFKKPPVKKPTVLPEALLNSEKPIVVFSATRLLNYKLRHSGVSRYARMVAAGLSIDTRVTPVFVYKPQKNDYGMSAYYFQQITEGMGIKLYKYDDALRELEATGRPYLFHSPIEPLPDTTDHPHMIKVITVHDIFHLTRPDLYTSGKFITGDVVNSIDSERDGVVFVSDYSRMEYERYTERKLALSAVTHLAVDRAFPVEGLKANSLATNRIPDNARLITFPYQGDPRKGYPRMIGIAQQWVSESTTNFVAVFGKSANRAEFDKFLIDSNFNRKQIIYLPDLDDRQLAALYMRADLQLYLSEAEGFGLPPLEAMSCGCPSLMFANTSLAEVYADWELLCKDDASDSEVLAKIKHVLEKSNRLKVRAQAQRFASRYDWFHTVEATVDFYMNVYQERYLSVCS